MLRVISTCLQHVWKARKETLSQILWDPEGPAGAERAVNRARRGLAKTEPSKASRRYKALHPEQHQECLSIVRFFCVCFEELVYHSDPSCLHTVLPRGSAFLCICLSFTLTRLVMNSSSADSWILCALMLFAAEIVASYFTRPTTATQPEFVCLLVCFTQLIRETSNKIPKLG